MFTRQHYVSVAASLRTARPFPGDSPDRWGGWHTTVVTIAQDFQADNPRFDRERFNRAAGLVDSRGALITRETLEREERLDRIAAVYPDAAAEARGIVR